MEHPTRPEGQIPEALAKIAGLLQTNPDLGERALRAYAALRGLSPEALRPFLIPSRRERAREAFQLPYLRHFAESLPRYPYATDDPTQGVRILKRENALKRVHIQVGHYPHAVLRLVVDVDLPWPLAEERLFALPPSLTLINLQTGHFHAWYEIDPIPLRVPPERQETLRRTLALLARVEALLEMFYGADPGYNGLLSWNPFLHPPEWTRGGGKRWTLEDLLRELQAHLPRGVRRAARWELASYGRNCTLFDRLRVEAYGQVNAFRGLPGGWEAFRAWVYQRAHALNHALFRDHPKGPLDPREVGHTAKSTSRWTWENYRGTRVWPTSSTG
ncbi:primase C-terminal domain-containing protein, partial [Thermus sp.]|uniref:primase C-terminal domain-containing protein n=1 Tax=Thermus sp. TaxID=275 RepID=UPI003D0B480F